MQQEGWTRVSVRRTHLELRRPRRAAAGPPRPPSRSSCVLRRPISAAEYLRALRVWSATSGSGATGSSGRTRSWSATCRRPTSTSGAPHVGRRDGRILRASPAPPTGRSRSMYFGLAPAFIGRGFGGWLLDAGRRGSVRARRAAHRAQHLHPRRAAGAAELPRARVHDRAARTSTCSTCRRRRRSG